MIIKDSNLRTYLFSIRYKILAVVIAVILLLLCIQMLNEFAKNELEERKKAQTTQTQNVYKPEQTVIVGDSVPKEKQKENETIIGTFIRYCNEGQIQNAYNLLTKECQEEVFFSNITNFENNYVKKNFQSQKTYNLQSWYNGLGQTYQVRILEDILSTGNANPTVVEEYMTVISDGSQKKLNINGYIGRSLMQTSKQVNRITITIPYKDIYKNYETYFFTIKNDTNQDIIIDSKERTDSFYLKSQLGSKFLSYVHEIEDANLQVFSKMSKTISIRFNKIYSNLTKMNSIVLEDIILNAKEYNQTKTKKDYKDRLQIEIPLS